MYNIVSIQSARFLVGKSHQKVLTVSTACGLIRLNVVSVYIAEGLDKNSLPTGIEVAY